MILIHHEESAKIVNQAIAAFGKGKKGLADRLNKDLSLVSRYASGGVRPKAETLLKCMEFIQEEVGSRSEGTHSSLDNKMYSAVKDVVSNLSSDRDADLIHALFKGKRLANHTLTP